MVKNTLVLVLAVIECLPFLFSAGYAQKTFTDSIYNITSQLKTNREKIDFLMKATETQLKESPNLADILIRKMESIAARETSQKIHQQIKILKGKHLYLTDNNVEALRLFSEIIAESADSLALVISHRYVGNIFYKLKNYDQPIQYYKRAILYLPAGKAEKLNKEKASLLNNIGIIYEETQRLDSAKKSYYEALSLVNEDQYPDIYATLINNLGTVFADEGNFLKAEQLYLKALEIRSRHHISHGVVRSFHNLAVFYIEASKNYDKAEQYLRKSITKSQELNDNYTWISALNWLYIITKNKGDYKKALEILELKTRVYDSIYSIENINKIAELEAKHRFKLQERAAKEQFRAQQLWYLVYLMLLILAVGLFVFLFFLQRYKNKKLRLMEAHLTLDKMKLENSLKYKNKELISNVLNLLNKNEMLNLISKKLLKTHSLQDKEKEVAIQRLVNEIRNNRDSALPNEFEKRFLELNDEFYNKLNQRFPNLTPNELKLCGFLKFNFSTKDISSITLQSVKSIDVARTRLRKKFNLTGTNVKLVMFFQQISANSKEN